MRRHFGGASVAHMATVGRDGRPHIVPICFALEGDSLHFVVDAKPKRTIYLKRLQNIAANPAVSIMADHYEDDWANLWWVRVDGAARLLTDGGEAGRALDLLINRYRQYQENRPGGPVVAVSIDRWSGWSGA